MFRAKSGLLENLRVQALRVHMNLQILIKELLFSYIDIEGEVLLLAGTKQTDQPVHFDLVGPY